MGLDGVLDDREAEAGAALLARAGLVDAVETLEDPADRLGRNARAVIAHTHLDQAAFKPAGGHRQLSTGAPVLDAVVHEIREHLPQPIRIRLGDQAARHLVLQPDVAPFGPLGEVAEHLLHGRLQRRGLGTQVDPPGIELRQQQQVVDEEGQAVGLAVDDGQQLHEGRRIRLAPIDQGLCGALDQRQRRAQLVTDIRHEFLPRTLELAEPGQVVEHQHRSRRDAGGVVQRDRVDLQDPRGRALQAQFVIQDGPFARHPRRHRRDLVVAHRLQQGAAHHLPRETEQGFRGPIREHDPSLGIHHDQSLDHAVEERLQPVLVVVQRLPVRRLQRGQLLRVRRRLGLPAPMGIPPGQGEADGEEEEKNGHGRSKARGPPTCQP